MSDNKDKWPSEGLIGAVAQGWSTEANGGKEMDSDLAFDIATSVHRYLQSRAAQPVVLSDERAWEIAVQCEGLDSVSWQPKPALCFANAKDFGDCLRAILTAKEQA